MYLSSEGYKLTEVYEALISNRNRQYQHPPDAVKAVPHHHPYSHQSNYYGRMQTAPNATDGQRTDRTQDQQQANSRWATRGGHYTRGRGRGRGAGVSQVYRNKSLVLNNATSAQTNASLTTNQTSAVQSDAASPSAWVSRSDRHLQLINPAIFEKQSQTRAKAIEETMKLKLKQKDERERKKLAKYLQRFGSATSNAQTTHEITIQDVKFCVTKNGSKLLKLPGKCFPGNYD